MRILDKLKFTEQQEEVIINRGGSLLVSAAAGTGKTRVLVERIMKRVADEGDEISDFIIITYTTAAAAELKGRIMEEIIRRSAASSADKHLRRQTAMVGGASIGTIHGFCGNVIREYAHDLDISPDFRNIDETEIDMIKDGVLTELIDSRYSEMSSHTGFQELADTLSSGRQDDGLIQTVLGAYNSLQSHPYPRLWIGQELERFDGNAAEDAADTHWGRYLMDETTKIAEYWIKEFHEAVYVIESDEQLHKYYSAQWMETIVNLIDLRDALKKGWDDVHDLGAVKFPRISKTPEGYEYLKEKRKRCMSEIKKALKIFSIDQSGVLDDIERSGLIANGFLSLILDFDSAYTAEKRRRNVLDFNDLEHQALNVLVERESGEPTAAARDIAMRYKEVMVDEFQDVNTVQNMIFSAITDKNLFVVGDVKQSIYRFRLANPAIFMEHYNTYPDASKDLTDEPRKVLLSRNFRSDKPVLDAVNFVFQHVMVSEFCGMDYREREFLVPGKKPEELAVSPVELNIINQDGFSSGEKAETADIEPAFVAQRIRKLIDSEGYSAGDIVILMRSRGKAWRYEREMKKLGIPVAGGAGDFYLSHEIMSLTAVLDIIDNPTRDVSLISAMFSPLFGFSEDELADISCDRRQGSFFDAVKRSAKSNDRCSEFLETLEKLRIMASDMSTQNLLWQVLEITDALSIYGAMDNGALRRENIMAMLEYAGGYEARGHRGLFRFLEMFKNEGEKGKLSGPEISFQGGAVRIMTIHSSKGLEFPVVILADMGKRFNSDDTKGNVLIHPELGVGIMLKDMERKIRYSTMPRDAVSKKIASENRQEEMRVLYVAMTRPERKLIMTASYANAETAMEKLAGMADRPLSPYVIGNVKSMAEWVLLPLMLTEEKSALGIEGASPLGSVDWDVNLVPWENFMGDNGKKHLVLPEADVEGAVLPSGGATAGSDAPSALEQGIKERVYYGYQYEDAVNLPSKLTATQIKSKLSEAAAEDAESMRRSKIPLLRPSFVTQRGELTGAQRGTAAHLVMQYADYSKCVSIEGIGEEISRLAALHLITNEQAEAVDTDMLFSFFKSTLGAQTLASRSPKREFKFSLLVPAEKYYPDAGKEEILLQGVIDCFFETDDGLVIIDFKTDNVTKKTVMERADSYAYQLDVYAYALSRITGSRVARKILFFFALGEGVELP